MFSAVKVKEQGEFRKENWLGWIYATQWEDMFQQA